MKVLQNDAVGIHQARTAELLRSILDSSSPEFAEFLSRIVGREEEETATMRELSFLRYSLASLAETRAQAWFCWDRAVDASYLILVDSSLRSVRRRFAQELMELEENKFDMFDPWSKEPNIWMCLRGGKDSRNAYQEVLKSSHTSHDPDNRLAKFVRWNWNWYVEALHVLSEQRSYESMPAAMKQDLYYYHAMWAEPDRYVIHSMEDWNLRELAHDIDDYARVARRSIGPQTSEKDSGAELPIRAEPEIRDLRTAAKRAFDVLDYWSDSDMTKVGNLIAETLFGYHSRLGTLLRTDRRDDAEEMINATLSYLESFASETAPSEEV